MVNNLRKMYLFINYNDNEILIKLTFFKKVGNEGNIDGIAFSLNRTYTSEVRSKHTSSKCSEQRCECGAGCQSFLDIASTHFFLSSGFFGNLKDSRVSF